MRDLSKIVNAMIKEIPNDSSSAMLKSLLTRELIRIRYTAPELVEAKWSDIQDILNKHIFFTSDLFNVKVNLGNDIWKEKVRQIWVGEIDIEEENDNELIFEYEG